MRCMDCIESNAQYQFEAEWILLTGPEMNYQAKILCDSHLQNWIEGEGDTNLNYKHLDDGIWFEVIEHLNKELTRAFKLYYEEIVENRDLKKKLAEQVEGISPHLLPNKAGLDSALQGLRYAQDCLFLVKNSVENQGRRST